MLIFWTHKSYKHIFVSDEKKGPYIAGHHEEVEIMNEFNIKNMDWDLTQFLMLVVLIEHIIIACKFLISHYFDTLPKGIIEQERERSALL